MVCGHAEKSAHPAVSDGVSEFVIDLLSEERAANVGVARIEIFGVILSEFDRPLADSQAKRNNPFAQDAKQMQLTALKAIPS